MINMLKLLLCRWPHEYLNKVCLYSNGVFLNLCKVKQIYGINSSVVYLFCKSLLFVALAIDWNTNNTDSKECHVAVVST